MEDHRSPTIRLLAGLVVTLSAVAVYSGFTFVQLRGLEALQTTTIDRNRLDSLLLLRIQGNLNQIALTMRDMLDGSEPYPLTAWQGPFKRIRTDLADARRPSWRQSGVLRRARRSDDLATGAAVGRLRRAVSLGAGRLPL